jgi:hypothetical protein
MTIDYFGHFYSAIFATTPNLSILDAMTAIAESSARFSSIIFIICCVKSVAFAVSLLVQCSGCDVASFEVLLRS